MEAVTLRIPVEAILSAMAMFHPQFIWSLDVKAPARAGAEG